MRLKQNIISCISVWQTLQIVLFLISENGFIDFLTSKNMNYLKNVLDFVYKTLDPANTPTKIEMTILVRFEVIQVSSFSEHSWFQENLQLKFT